MPLKDQRRQKLCHCHSLFYTCGLLQQVSLLLLLLTSRKCIAERAYPLGCSLQDSSYYDYDNFPFPPTNNNDNIAIRTTKDYLLVRRLGAGKFSDVFEAVDVQKIKQQQQQQQGMTTTATSITTIDPESLVVIKCLKPVSERKIKRELLVLQHASKLPNLARLQAVVLPSHYFSSSDKETISTMNDNKNEVKATTKPSKTPTSTLSSKTTTKTNKKQSSNNNNNNNNYNNNNNNNKKRLLPMPSIVLQHAGIHSQWLCHTKDSYLTEYEIQYYLYHLLYALDALHSIGIMHRDVKPRNVLLNKQIKISPSTTTTSTFPLMLIDLGLADFYLPNTRYNVRVASRHYKSPELLLGYEYYDYAIDMWGVGCILAGLLLRREPFFRGKDNMDQLYKIVSVLGTAELHAYLSKYNIEITKDIRKVIAKVTLQNGGKQQDWTMFYTNNNVDKNNNNNNNNNDGSSAINSHRQQQQDDSSAASFVSPSRDGIDLLSKLLVYNHEQRLTAKQAMKHSFFDAVRDRVEREIQSYYHHHHETRKENETIGN